MLALALITVVAATPTAFGGNAQTFSDLRVVSSSSSELTHATSLLRQTGAVQRVGNYAIAYDAASDVATTTVMVLRGAQEARVDGVPVTALDARTILKNDDRIVWAQASDKSARFDVYELDLEQGARVQRFNDIFLGDASRVNVRVDGNTYYFEVQNVKTLRNGLPQVEILRATSTSGNTQTVNAMWRSQFEAIEDISNGRVVTHVVFENGDQELWVHENGTSRAIPDSYTVNGYLLGTQLVGDTVEFFRYQRLMRYDMVTWKTEALNDRLMWERSITAQMDRFVAFGGTMFFVTYNEQDGRHYVMRRKSGVTTTISLWEGSPFVQNGSLVSFARADQFANGYDTYNVQTGIHVMHEGDIQWVDDHIGSRLVVDKDGRVIWKLGSSRTIVGTAPQGRAYFADAGHVAIPQGAGRPIVYVTIRPQAWFMPRDVLFAKFSNSPTVYLLKDKKRYVVPNEGVFYSWEKDFSRVVDMSLINVQAYTDGGLAPYAPGTMIKSPASNSVSMVTSNFMVFPVENAAEALEMYGPYWWTYVRSIPESEMSRYHTMAQLMQE